MKILTSFNQLNKPGILAIGTFDGVHLGHQLVLKTAFSEAKKKNLPFGVLTFQNHPMTLINPAKAPKSLISLQGKRQLIADQGAEFMLEINFDEHFSQISPFDFVELFKFWEIVVGESFRFGNGGSGDPSDFYKKIICKNVFCGSDIVSSTRIRQAVAEGNMHMAAEMLGRPYEIVGNVVKGDQRGKKLGFPTANINFGDYEVPKFGVYAGMVAVENKWHKAVVNVGNNPTFPSLKARIEAHILDFDQNIYDWEIKVIFCHYLRPEQKFMAVSELQQQMGKDKETACTYLQNMV